jgi:hypothetical protein
MVAEFSTCIADVAKFVARTSERLEMYTATSEMQLLPTEQAPFLPHSKEEHPNQPPNACQCSKTPNLIYMHERRKEHLPLEYSWCVESSRALQQLARLQ